MMGYNALRRALQKMRYPAVDSNGNLLASVTPRTGTLATLLSIANAGNGEVATATDVNAQVVYRGDPSVGKATFRYKRATYAIAALHNTTAIPTGVATPVDFAAAGHTDPDAQVDATANVITLDSTIIHNSATLGFGLAVSGYIKPSAAGATYLKLEFEADLTGGGVWAPLGDLGTIVIPQVAAIVTPAPFSTPQFAMPALYVDKAIRMKITHDAGADRTFGGSYVMLEAFLHSSL